MKKVFARSIAPAGVLIVCAIAWHGLATAPLLANDWPQYRGPSRHGVSAETGMLESWSDRGPKELWRREVGTGFSGMAIADGRLYTMAARDGEEFVLCLDAQTGEALWRTGVGDQFISEFGDGPRSTPTIDNGVVFTVASSAKLLALDAKSGKILWQNAAEELGNAPRFGYSTSPLIEQGLVIVEMGGGDEGPGAAAFDRVSGKLKWRALKAPASYSSPIAVDIAGTRQLIFSRRTEVVALSIQGEQLWRYETGRRAAIPVPIFLPPNRLFVSSSDDSFGGVMLQVTRDDSGFKVKPAWTERRMRNHFNSSVRVGDYLYGFDNATLKCLDAGTGELQWAKRGYGKGSLVATQDLLFVLSDNGRLILVPATAEGFSQVGLVQAMKGKSWTSPSLAGGRIFVRDLDEIVSYDLKRLQEVEAKPTEGAGVETTAEAGAR